MNKDEPPEDSGRKSSDQGSDKDKISREIRYKILLLDVLRCIEDNNQRAELFDGSRRVQLDIDMFLDKFETLKGDAPVPDLEQLIDTMTNKAILDHYIDIYHDARRTADYRWRRGITRVALDWSESENFLHVFENGYRFSLMIYLILIYEIIDKIKEVDNFIIIRLIESSVSYKTLLLAIVKYNLINYKELSSILVNQMSKDPSSYVPLFNYLPSSYHPRFSRKMNELNEFELQVYKDMGKNAVTILEAFSYDTFTEKYDPFHQHYYFDIIENFLDIFFKHCKSEIKAVLTRSKLLSFDSAVILALSKLNRLSEDIAAAYVTKNRTFLKIKLEHIYRQIIYEEKSDNTSTKPVQINKTFLSLQSILTKNLFVRKYYLVSEMIDNHGWSIPDDYLEKTISDAFNLDDLVRYYSLLNSELRCHGWFDSDLKTIFLKKAEESLSDSDTTKFKAILDTIKIPEI